MSNDYQAYIKELYRQQKFIHPESLILEKDYRQLLSVIDIQEFFLHSNLNPTDSYNQAVFRACRKACMYILFAINQKLRMGKYMLKDIQICDGFVGKTPHTWLLLGNEYFVDMTLAQFTSLEIPELSILPVELGSNIYHINHTFTWQQWVSLETEAM